ncbi:MAG: lipocalin family protein [Capsulimonadaceae bacterium]
MFEVGLAVAGLVLAMLAGAAAWGAPTHIPAAFPAVPHADSTVEWWYANAHVTTRHGRRLALVAAFFKFQAPPSLLTGEPRPPSHYLIYGVTDLDTGEHRAYSVADAPMLTGLRDLLLLAGPSDRHAQAVLKALLAGNAPPQSSKMQGPVEITARPFALAYGADGLRALSRDNRSFALRLGSGADKIDIDLTAVRPTMNVGGRGETGLVTPTDMYYFSLTRCRVDGHVDGDQVAGGRGWIDHQWGTSWTTQNDGWDWWGVQLNNGVDILVFEQRDLATGRPFFPLATFMDRNGEQGVTRDIRFVPLRGRIWRSPRTGVAYPLRWKIRFPSRGIAIRITPDANSQEMPILGPGGSIWEGSCHVTAMYFRTRHAVNGVAYMELVGYGSPVMRKRLP